MGRKKRVGRDRKTGPDPLARLASAPAAQEPSPWGVTGMPSWLDTPPGRQAWAAQEDDAPLDDDGTPAAASPESTGADEDWGEGDWPDDDWPAAEDEWPGEDWPGDDEFPDDDWPGDDGEGDQRLRQAPGQRRPGLESLGDGDDDEDWASEEWQPPKNRLTMLPPAAIGLIIIGVIACVIAGYSLLKSNEPVAPLVAFESSAGPRTPSTTPKPDASGPSPTADEPARQLIVSVVGLVNHPGLVRLPQSARVADAIERAGGARPGADLLSLNLAQLLRDGDQVLVGKGGVGMVKSAVVAASGAPPASGAPASGPPAGGSDPAPGTGPVDLNSATAEQLDALPGVGPVTAAAILAWRETNGRFSSVEQLAEIDGIGPARLAKLTPLVTVG